MYDRYDALTFLDVILSLPVRMSAAERDAFAQRLGDRANDTDDPSVAALCSAVYDYMRDNTSEA